MSKEIRAELGGETQIGFFSQVLQENTSRKRKTHSDEVSLPQGSTGILHNSLRWSTCCSLYGLCPLTAPLLPIPLLLCSPVNDLHIPPPFRTGTVYLTPKISYLKDFDFVKKLLWQQRRMMKPGVPCPPARLSQQKDVGTSTGKASSA